MHFLCRCWRCFHVIAHCGCTDPNKPVRYGLCIGCQNEVAKILEREKKAKAS